MSKRIWSLIAVMCLVLSVAGCGFVLAENQFSGLKYVYGDEEVQVTNIEISNKKFILTMDFCSRSSSAAAYFTSFSVTGYQGGVECDYAYISDSNTTKNIKNGAVITVKDGFTLFNTSDIVEIVIEPWINWNSPTLVFYVDPKTGEWSTNKNTLRNDAPAVSSTNNTASDQYPGLKYTKDGVSVQVTNIEITNNKFVMSMQFYDESASSASYFTTFSVKGFQNGVECDYAYIPDSNTTKEIRKGASITVKDGFTLVNRTDIIEIIIEPWISWDSNDNLTFYYDPQTGNWSLTRPQSAQTNSSKGGSSVVPEQYRGLRYEKDGCSVQVTNIERTNGNLVLTMEFSNAGKTSEAYYLTFSVSGYQRGIECDYAYISDSNASKEIKNGSTITVKDGFKLENSKDVVEVIIGPWISFGNVETLTFYVDPSDCSWYTR